MLSFPGEDSIRARAIDAHFEGCEARDSHHRGCPLYGITEEDMEDEPGECLCHELEAQDAEDMEADAKLDAMERGGYW